VILQLPPFLVRLFPGTSEWFAKPPYLDASGNKLLALSRHRSRRWDDHKRLGGLRARQGCERIARN
jgi:hypothetical protein